MELDEINAFLAVVEQGNITKAADRLYTTQSSISKKIHALESEFRIQLFFRGKGHRNVELTPVGEQFLILCRKWQNLKKEAESLSQQSSQLHLSVGAIELINSFTFTDFYNDLLEKHAELYMNIHTHHSSEIYHLAADHYVDLGYVYNRQVHNELIVRPLFEENMLIVSNENSYYNEKIDPSDLDPKEEIYLKWSSDYEFWHDQIWPNHQFRLHIGSSQMIANFLNQENRWAVVPASVIKGMQTRSDFKIHTLSVDMPVRTCYEVESRFPRLSRKESMDVFKKDLRNFLKNNEEIKLLP